MNVLLETWATIRIMPPTAKRWAIFQEVLSRIYGTLMAALFGLFEANSPSILWVIIASGIIIDVSRNLLAPELRMTPKQMYAYLRPYAVEGKKNEGEGVFGKIMVTIWAAWLVHMVWFLLVAPPHEIVPSPWIVTHTTGLQDFVASFSNPVRRIPLDLIAHDYPNRAAEARYSFTVGTLFFVITIVYWLFGTCQVLARSGLIALVNGTGKRRWTSGDSRKNVIIGFSATVLFYTFYNWVYISWNHPRQVFHPESENQSFCMYFLCMWLASCFFGMGTYVCLIKARITMLLHYGQFSFFDNTIKIASSGG